jgi:hypothetical protein
VALLLGAGALSVHLYLGALEKDGTRISFASPSGGVAFSVNPPVVEPSPDLAAEGLACANLGTSADAQQWIILRKERYAVQVELSAKDRELDLSGLSYVLHGGDGEEVGRGAVPLSGRLKPGESRAVEIPDYRIPEARRIVISK